MAKTFSFDDIRRHREAGLTVKETAARLGCSESTVHNALREMGLLTGHRQFAVPRDRLLELWNRGLTLTEMGIACGCSASTMSNLVRAAKLPKRSRPNMSEGVDPTPSEIEERARECRERHYAQRRAETHECSAMKAWRHKA